jgi:hypothetical protein
VVGADCLQSDTRVRHQLALVSPGAALLKGPVMPPGG